MASIGQALFPRSTERASIPAYHPRAVLDAAFDVASMPGRAYASLGRPSAESYSDAMARTGPTGAMPGAMYQGEGDEFADMVLRDPFLPLGAMLSAAAPVRALGQYGRAGVEGAFNAGGSMADQYATTGRAELAPSLLAGVTGAAPGVLPAGRNTRAAMISPEGSVSYRFTAKDSPMSDWGHAMFADNRDAVSRIYGKNEYRVPASGLTDVRSLDDAIRAAWESRDLGRSMSAADAAYYDDLTPDDISDQLVNVGDIVNTAKGYDSPLVNWLYDAVIEPRGIRGVKTPDGAVVFDPEIIKKVNQSQFSGPSFAAQKTSSRAATPTQTLGSRLSAQAKHAALREYLSDDRPQGDTHYTSRSSR